MYDKLKLLAKANEIMDLDEQFPYEASSTDDEDLSHDSGHKSHCHISLKMRISMRWNSTLQMLLSVDDLKDCIINM